MKHYDKLAFSYLHLTNAQTKKYAIEHLDMMVKCSNEFAECILKILTAWDVPPRLIRNVNQFTKPNLDNLWLNTTQFFNRFLYADTPDKKKLELTSLYYLAKDLALCAGETKVKRYFR